MIWLRSACNPENSVTCELRPLVLASPACPHACYLNVDIEREPQQVHILLPHLAICFVLQDDARGIVAKEELFKLHRVAAHECQKCCAM